MTIWSASLPLPRISRLTLLIKETEFVSSSGVVGGDVLECDVGLPECPANQAKKFLTGKGNCDKNLILLKVFQKYGIECEDDNVADAINLNMIGRALLGWTPVSNDMQRAVLADLSKPPKAKGTRKKSKAA